MTQYLIFFIIIFICVIISLALTIHKLKIELYGEKEEEIKPQHNRLNALMFLIFGIAFFVFFIYQCYSWKDLLLPIAASIHGVETDALLNFNFAIIIFVFFVTNAFLFFFASKYYFNKDRKADFFTHSNKLEIIWTIVPAVVLGVIIIYGLKTWNGIMDTAPEEALKIELYAKQFSWTARYTGTDGELGNSSVRLITGDNSLGMDSADARGWDDVVIRNEFHIPVNKPVLFLYRSQDVIHSAYMPHFRAQMNCVPGMTTQFHFVPTITTAEMKKITNNKDFDYVLLCNKICGAAHFNMQMNIVVDTQEDYDKWLKEMTTQYTFFKGKTPKTATAELSLGK